MATGRHAAPGRAGVALAGLPAAAGVTLTAVLWRGSPLGWAALVPIVVLSVLVLSLAVVPQRARCAMPRGAVVAVIPAYRENTDALHGTITSLLRGTRVPDVIHVVDDGSPDPIPPLIDSRVVWHRTLNYGKRQAQATALRAHTGPIEYVLTVDSDCTVDRYAVARLTRAMADERVQAATGLPLARNMSSWLVRIIDLEITSICLTYRSARSRISGSLTTCSGALSLYRAGVVLNHLDEYANENYAAGDDRRLTHYAMRRGRVVSTPDAVVHTDMPDTIHALWRQRVRWSSSHWRYAFWEVAHLPMQAAAWTMYHIMLSIIVPVGIAWSLLVLPLLGQGVAWQFLGYWTVICWLLNIRYIPARKQLHPVRRTAIWLVGTPALVVLHLIVLRPAMLYALTQTRSTHWGTRTSVLSGGQRLSPVTTSA